MPHASFVLLVKEFRCALNSDNVTQMRLYCTAEVKPEEIMTRKDKDKEGRAVHKGLFQKCKINKMTKNEIIRGTTHFTKARLNLNY